MDKLEEIVKDYLHAENTDYAIMINGNWGCGKTYYIQNNIFTKIREIKSQVKNTPVKHKMWHFKSKDNPEFKPYEPIYISLYGLSNVDSIMPKIFSSLYPIFQNKAFSAINLIINRILKFKNIDEISEAEWKTLESFVEISPNKVLVFDDIERISENLRIQDVLGFLNTYTEHRKQKMLIICNDKEFHSEYLHFKEKTVRFTYNYQASIDLVYDNIISKFKSTEYRAFLSENKNILLSIFETAQYTNLRTLRFILEIFQKLFNAVINTEYKKQILKRFFFFTTIYSVEYKNGVAEKDLDSLSKVEGYSYINQFPFLNKNDQLNIEKEPEYFEKFCVKYSSIFTSFYYYPAIANYIQFGYISEDFRVLTMAIENDIKKDEESEEKVILNKLRNWELIEDKEFNGLIKHVLKLVSECKFNLYTYPTIYAELLQFEYMQIENFKLTSENKDIFFKAIDKSKNRHKFDCDFRRKIQQWDNTDESGFKEKYKEIYDYAISANEDVGKSEQQEEIEKFVDVVSSNNIKGLEEYMHNNDIKNIIKKISAETLFKKLLLADGATIKVFVNGIYSFYPENNSSSLSVEESIFFNEFKEHLNDYLSKTEKKPIKSAFLFFLRKKIEALASNYDVLQKPKKY